MSVNEISQYWDRKAESLKTDPAATMKDVVLRSLEIDAVGARLRAEDVLLDVGAGNAFGSLQWAERCAEVLATDFSEKMVEAAREAIAESGRANIRAERANVLDLGAYAGKFTAVSCVRCLINLTGEEEQLRAVAQLAGALGEGGRLFLIEGLAETFAGMNEAREQARLPPIPLNWHNRLLERAKLEAALSESLTIEERVDFGEYYFLSRVVHPLLVAPEEPAFDGRLNLVARDLWHSGTARGRFSDLSTLVLYVCRRR
jgi:ubiquinone/menaquinone biosynthesis C-methylase UbiE